MALTKCRECGNEVSDKADACPHCGARPKKSRKVGCLTIIFVILVVAFLANIGGRNTSTKNSSSSSANTTQTTKVQSREDKIKLQFSAWDGSHRGLERFIKNSMHDPDSYDHVETVYWDRGDHLIVRTTFRGKNAFGGLVKNWVKAKVDLDGNILNIIEKGN